MEASSDACQERGNQCMKEDKYVEAMFHYTHGIKLDPGSGYLYSNRSLSFLRMQQHYHALENAKTTHANIVKVKSNVLLSITRKPSNRTLAHSRMQMRNS